MTNARLIILSAGQPERLFDIDGEASIGRASDNLICIDDVMVSQYHAVIERRGDEFWLSDLASTNGTTLNGDLVTGERLLCNGDSISIGGVATLEFRSDDIPAESHERHVEADSEIISAATGDSEYEPQSAQTNSTKSASPVWIAAAVVAGILIAGAVALIVANLAGNTDGEVRVLSPETGSTIRGPQTIRVEAERAKDIDEVIYLLDGVEFASAEHPPFEVTLDPSHLETKVRNLARGNHVLTITVQDKEGNKIPQPDTILLAFDMNNAADDSNEIDKPSEDVNNGSITQKLPQGQIDVVALSRNLAATISGKSWYDFDPQFADEIRRQTSVYRIKVMDDASRYRRQIGNAFNSKGLPAAIGFVMALSESRFREDSGSSDSRIGFWQVPRQIAIEQGYITSDESSTDLKDAKRAAEIAASYINDLVNAMGGMDNFMYAIACYGKPLSEAAKVRARLEETDADATGRKNFWRMAQAGVVTRDGADRVAKFFAAGIVGENPHAFGLNSKPLSSLY